MEAVKTPQQKGSPKGTTTAAVTAAKPQDRTLAQQIIFYNRMAHLAKTRARFVQTLDELAALDFKAVDDVETFENSEKFKLILKKDYNTEILSVSNDFILHEFKVFMSARISAKIEVIDAEILS